MRALNKGWIGVALVILFGASLFFFRGSSRYSNLFNSDNFVANISGTPIPTSQFLRSLEMNIGQFAQMIGEELSGDQIRAFQIHQLVLQNLVNNAIFENEFDKLNFILDDSIIAEQTKKRFPILYNNNKINDDALNNFLRQQRLKIEDLVNIISYETRSNVFDTLLFEKNYPNSLSKKINLFNEHARTIELLKIPFNKISLTEFDEKKITKTNKELLNYFEDNNLAYMSPETRDITYILIDKAAYKKSFIPSESEISNYFGENKNIFTIPEKRSFKQFNFKTAKDANNFKNNITGFSNEEIEDYALANNIKYNEFQNVEKNQVLEELSNAIFSLSKNEISEIVKTTLAHHVIILDNIDVERTPVLNEVSDEIKTTLTNVKLENFFIDLKQKINKQILDGFSIEEIAIDNGLSVQDIFNQSNELKDIENVKSSIISVAFTQNKDFISDIKDFDNEKSFIVNVNKIYPSKAKNIDNAFEQVKVDFIKSKKFQFAENIYKKNKFKFNSLENINSKYEIKIEKINVTFGSDNLPKTLINNIFNSEVNSTTFSSDDNNAYFARLNNIDMPIEIEFYKDLNLLSELKNAFGNEIIKTKKISYNDELINGLLSQYK